MKLAQELSQLIDGEVFSDEETLKKFSRDASVFEMTPQVVVAPKTVEDIKNLVTFVNRNKKSGLSLTPRAAGTCMSGGPLTRSIAVDMMVHFNKVLEVGKDNAVTQPGVFYRDFDLKTKKRNLYLPSYPASRELCAVGGMVGNNSSGEQTLGHGATIKYVKRIKAVLSDGNEYTFEPLTTKRLHAKMRQKNFEGQLYRKIHALIVENEELITKARPQVTKNSMGYYLWDVMQEKSFDLTKLLVGSQGTLGIITEIEFKLVRPKKYHSLLVMNLHNLDNLDKIVNKILEFKPESFECFDDQTMTYALKYFSEIVHRFKVCHGAKLYLQFLPDFKNMLTGTMPKLVLMADFASDKEAESVAQAQQALEAALELDIEAKLISSPEFSEKYWVVRRESFRLLKGHSHNMTSAPIIDDIIVLPEKLPEFLPRLNKIMDKYKDKMIYTLAGHIGSGNFHIIPLMDLSNPKIRKIVPNLIDEVHELTLEFGGSLAAEHNDGLIRGPYLEKMFGKKMYTLFKQVKDIFDPHGVFNPNKKVNITLDEALKYMHYN